MLIARNLYDMGMDSTTAITDYVGVVAAKLNVSPADVLANLLAEDNRGGGPRSKGNPADAARQRANLFAVWRGRCVWCACKLQVEDHTAPNYMQRDHYVTHGLARTYWVGVIVPACDACNKARGDMGGREWADRCGIDWRAIESVLIGGIPGARRIAKSGGIDPRSLKL